MSVEALQHPDRAVYLYWIRRFIVENGKRHPRDMGAVEVEAFLSRLATRDDVAGTVAGCELVLEALVARRKISRTEGGEYGRAMPEQRRRPRNDAYGEGFA